MVKDGMGLSEVLASREFDLFEALVRCGISCRTCYMNYGRFVADSNSFKSFDCRKANIFVSAPELSVCMKWRDGLSNEMRKKVRDAGSYDPLEE